MPRKKKEVIEAEEVRVEEVAQEEVQKPISSGILIAQTEDGGVYLQLLGTDQNIIAIEGLLQYARKHLDAKVWPDKLAPRQ